jgi:hypothetical protein
VIPSESREKTKRLGSEFEFRCDLDLVRDWGVDIREELLTPGQRTEHVCASAQPQ